MPFDTGVPPPRSKYHGMKLCVENLDICPDADEFEDTEPDDLLVTTDYDEENYCDEEKDEEFIKENQKLQSFTYQDWLEEIEKRYFDERDDLVRQLFQTALNDVPEPFPFILHVILQCFFDLYSKRIPITFFALDELDTWIELKKQNGDYVPKPAENHKLQAMEFLCRSGYNYLDKINKVFLLDEGDNSFLSKCINLDGEFMKGKKIKQSAVIIYTLKLQHCFDSKEIMLALLASDHIQLLETYIGDDEKLQVEYVSFLDSLCALPENSVTEMVREKGLRVKDSSKLQHKTLIKIAEKAVKSYKLNPDDYPDVFDAKNMDALNYWVRMKCKEERSSSSQAVSQKWDDLIETAVSGKRRYQMKLIQKLVDFSNIPAACKWAVKYDIAPDKLPFVVRDQLVHYVRSFKDQRISDSNRRDESEIESTGETSQEDWEQEYSSDSSAVSFSLSSGFMSQDEAASLEDEFYKLNISNHQIFLIDTIEKLGKMSKELFKNAKVIGFDAEWKPMICRAGEQERVSILQLAVKGTVYIVDLFKLYVTENAEDALKEFLTLFFTSKNVIKIGYGIVGDLKILIGMFGYAKELIANCVKLVDLGEVSRAVINHQLVIPCLHASTRGSVMEKGLSKLVSQTLGKKLDKTFQVSDWERRPLSAEQIHYAALDAYCLLEVYSFLQDVVKKTKIEANLEANVKLKWLKPDSKASKRKDKFENKEHKELIPENKPLFKGPPKPSTSLKVVCDTMLQGLGKYLRACGIDALVLENHQDHSSVINIALRDKRVILTRGKPFFMLRGYVPEGMCMWVPDEPLREQLKAIFTRYNIALQTKDILCRCTACNCDKYVEIPSGEMKLTFELKHDVGDREMPAEQKTESGLVNLSNFTLQNGVELQLDFISSAKLDRVKEDQSYNRLFDRVDTFFVCSDCGKVYWEGTHHTAVKENFAHLIDKRETDKFCYGTPG